MSTLTVFAQLQEARKPSWWIAARHSGPVAAIVASMVMVAFLGAASSRASAPPGQDHQPLSARRLAAGEIELEWNAHDPQLRSADEGILTIVDGGNERSEYLGVDAIQRGSYRYQRQSWDVWFCLRLFHN